jgi:hypothetical protein
MSCLFRRRGGHNNNRASSSNGDSSSSTSDSFDTSDDDLDNSASDEEIRAIERRDTNPFHSLQIPRIVVESNSPVPTLPAVIRRGPPPPDVVPAAQYVAQRVPLGGPTTASSTTVGPTPPGTALYRPRYQQYRTPDLTSRSGGAVTGATAPFFRPAVINSAAMSNSLKKNWVVPTAPMSTGAGGGGGGAGQQPQQRRVDQSEIDARLKSLMDRLSSQQASGKEGRGGGANRSLLFSYFVMKTRERYESSFGTVSRKPLHASF